MVSEIGFVALFFGTSQKTEPVFPIEGNCRGVGVDSEKAASGFVVGHHPVFDKIHRFCSPMFGLTTIFVADSETSDFYGRIVIAMLIMRKFFLYFPPKTSREHVGRNLVV